MKWFEGKLYKMKIKYHILLIAFFCFNVSGLLAQSNSVSINFYNEILKVNYDKSVIVPLGSEISEESFEKFYYNLSNTQYYTLVGNLLHHKSKLNLNDWFYYKLIISTVDKLFTKESNNYKTLFSWFLLHKSGYRVQINYVGNEVMLSVFSLDKVYDMPVKQHKEGWFVDITLFNNVTKLISMRPTFKINGDGKAFSFKLKQLPNLKNADIVNKKLSFVHENQLHTIDVQLNKSLLYLMYGYPELSIKEHTQIELSSTAYNSLIPSLKALIKDKPTYEAISILLSFTRQAMQYRPDELAYEIPNITFSAEETLFYKYSDCEDRSVLFYYLVNQLLEVDVILVDFPQHASTAVLFDKAYGGKPIIHKNKKYSICDPTGPGNHLKPGDYPEGLLGLNYKILEY